MSSYDLLIVGAGLTGAVFAERAAQKGKKVLVIDKRDHLAGNAYTAKVGVIVYNQEPMEECLRNILKKHPSPVKTPCVIKEKKKRVKAVKDSA